MDNNSEKKRISLKVYDAIRMLRGCSTSLDMADLPKEADQLKLAFDQLQLVFVSLSDE